MCVLKRLDKIFMIFSNQNHHHQIEKSNNAFSDASPSPSPVSPEDLDKEMSACLSNLDHILDRLDVLGSSSSPVAIPDLYFEISNSVERTWNILDRSATNDANGWKRLLF